MNGQYPLSENRVTKGQMNEIIFKPVSVSLKFIIQIYRTRYNLFRMFQFQFKKARRAKRYHQTMVCRRIELQDSGRRGHAFDLIQKRVSISMVFLFDHMFHVTHDVYICIFSPPNVISPTRDFALVSALIEHNRISFSTFKTLCIGNRECTIFIGHISIFSRTTF